MQALPLLMVGIREAGHARLLAFIPTMHKTRRASSRHWLEQLEDLAERYETKVLTPIGDPVLLRKRSCNGPGGAFVVCNGTSTLEVMHQQRVRRMMRQLEAYTDGFLGS